MEDFYRKWIQLQGNNQQNPEYDSFQQSENEPEALPSQNQDSEDKEGNQKLEYPSDIIYETNDLKLVVEKTSLKRQKVFKLQDHLFKIKIVPKNLSEEPILMNILDFLHAGFIHILDKIKSFYKPDDHNIAYLTLIQKPMVSALNTGSFDLQDPEAAADITDRILSMLSQYLLSNQSLVLNETFEVYIKVLSIHHMKFRQTTKSR